MNVVDGDDNLTVIARCFAFTCGAVILGTLRA
jgi:hypothetical protein